VKVLVLVQGLVVQQVLVPVVLVHQVPVLVPVLVQQVLVVLVVPLVQHRH
jgi:hypothetical protein